MLKEVHTILVVDDEPVSLLMLEKVLRRKFQIITAASGQGALEILKSRRVSMLIADHVMPGMSGTELLRAGQAIDPAMVCLLITAEKDVGVFIDAIMNAGAIRVINKPWEAESLLQVVEAVLAKYETLIAHKKAMSQLKRASDSLNKIVKIN